MGKDIKLKNVRAEKEITSVATLYTPAQNDASLILELLFQKIEKNQSLCASFLWFFAGMSKVLGNSQAGIYCTKTFVNATATY